MDNDAPIRISRLIDQKKKQTENVMAPKFKAVEWFILW